MGAVTVSWRIAVVVCMRNMYLCPSDEISRHDYSFRCSGLVCRKSETDSQECSHHVHPAIISPDSASAISNTAAGLGDDRAVVQNLERMDSFVHRNHEP